MVLGIHAMRSATHHAWNAKSHVLPVVHHSLYSAPQLPPGHRFPMGVFQQIYEVLMCKKWMSEEQVHAPQELASREVIQLVHCKDYTAAFLEGRLPAAMKRRIGFGDCVNDQELIDRTLVEVSGTLLTAQLALKHGMAVNTAGGTHHAFRSSGSGFCILNDIAITIEWLLAAGCIKKALVVDLDVHQGDGTASIFHARDEVFTFSMHAQNNFPARKQKSTLDIGLPDGTGDDEYIHALSEQLPEVLRKFQPDVVLYDAGVDVHQGDALGKLNLTDEGIFRRDLLVLDTCFGHDIPVAGLVGGGYADCLHVLANRHCSLHRAAHKVLFPSSFLEEEHDTKNPG